MLKRVLMMVFRNILAVPYMWIKLCYYAKHTDDIPEDKKYSFLRWIVQRACTGGNVIVQSFGAEQLPKNTSYIMYPNHQGMFDALAILNACDAYVSIVSKIEVKNVQFLKQVFAIIKAQFMDREDVRQSMKVIMEVTKEVKAGRNYIIFPEGTRSKNGNQVGEFKGGSFKCATGAKCPIVPVALINSFVPFDSHSIEPVTVQVHFLKPIPYEEYKDMKTTEIAELVRARIVETIEANI